MTSRDSLSIVVFGFNEAGNVSATVDEVRAFLEGTGRDFEILLVDDGSTDDTGRVMDDIAVPDGRVRVFHHPANLGIGAALKTGFGAARMDLVVPIPADGQIPASAIGTLLDGLDHGDLVIASYARRGDGVLRTFLSFGFRVVLRLVTGIDPDTHGFYLVRRSLVAELEPRSDSFFYNLELPILAIRARKSVSHVTIAPRPRLSGRSKVLRPGRLALVLRELARLRLKRFRERR